MHGPPQATPPAPHGLHPINLPKGRRIWSTAAPDREEVVWLYNYTSSNATIIQAAGASPYLGNAAVKIDDPS